MKFLNIIAVLFLLIGIAFSIFQNTKVIDCKILKDISLKYINNKDTTAFFTIKNREHIEYFEDKKYFIKSDLEWLSDCEYKVTITEVTVPDFSFKPGEEMNVKFEKNEDGFIFGTLTTRGNSFPVKYEIVK